MADQRNEAWTQLLVCIAAVAKALREGYPENAAVLDEAASLARELRKACEEREAELAAVCDAVAAASDARPPYHAYGDSQAACAMSDSIDELASLAAATKGGAVKRCRRCSDCPGQDHHWMDTVAYECKHCDALAKACEDCMEAPASAGRLCGDCAQHRHEPAAAKGGRRG